MSRSKRSSLIALIAVSLCIALIAVAEARPRPAGKTRGDFQANKTFGLGLMVGSPSGLSGKLYLSRDTALDFGLGYTHHYRTRAYRGLHAHMDFLWHPVVLAKVDPFHLPLYFGIGGRFWEHGSGGHGHLGLRVPVGISMDFNNVPLDIFLELAFVLDLIFIDDYNHGHGYTHLNGALGIRYYFN
jgi:hypothetical protein